MSAISKLNNLIYLETMCTTETYKSRIRDIKKSFQFIWANSLALKSKEIRLNITFQPFCSQITSFFSDSFSVKLKLISPFIFLS